MVTAVVLIEAQTDKINDLAMSLVEVDGIHEVFSVAGRYDLVAIIRVAKNEDVADVVSGPMRHQEGIVKTPPARSANNPWLIMWPRMTRATAG